MTYELTMMSIEITSSQDFDKLPFTQYIQAKSLHADLPQGAWYRGTLHFGIALHKAIQEASSDHSLKYNECSKKAA